MKHTTAGLLTALALTAAAPAVALADTTQERPGYTFTRTPSRGKPGTVIYVEGTGCAYEGKPYEYAKVYLFFREKNGSVTTEAEQRYDIQDDGSFSGDLAVPDDARVGRYLMDATCYASDMAFHVADSHFTVDAPKPSPKPTPKRTRTPTLTPPATTPPPPRPTTSPASTPPPKATRTAPPAASRTAGRALPSPTLPPVATPSRSPSPSAVARAQPAQSGQSRAVVTAALALIFLIAFGIRAVARLPR